MSQNPTPAADVLGPGTPEFIDASVCFTTPRYGPVIHFKVIADIMAAIPWKRSQFSPGGPLWEQGITAQIKQSLKRDNKYLFFTDYDSVFIPSDVIALYKIIEANPQIDCLWGCESSRLSTRPLTHAWNNGKKFFPDASPITYNYNVSLTPQPHGHFGMTFIRRSVFEAMAEPWFWGQPAQDGTWDYNKPGKMDADTYFWVKLLGIHSRTGHYSAQANNLVVGHMQEMIRWQHGPEVICQTVQEFLIYGKPDGCRAPLNHEAVEVATDVQAPPPGWLRRGGVGGVQPGAAATAPEASPEPVPQENADAGTTPPAAP